MSALPRGEGRTVGVALVVIGVLVLVIKVLGGALFALVFRLLWPIVLIGIGWRMWKKAGSKKADDRKAETGPSGAES